MSSYTDSLAVSWLTLAYGEDESSRIMELPAELRESLYGDVLDLGPAGDQIVKALQATPQDPKTHPELWKAIGDLGVAFPSSTSEDEFTEWVFALYAPLNANLREKTISRWPDVSRGALFLVWMLNGQYLFPPNIVNLMFAFEVTNRANTILALMGLPPLRGRLLKTATKSRIDRPLKEGSSS